ncbi:MAG TPA: amidohydrolase family protein [Thermoanaerobaculaceae bacterium]|nr:amidohydrolase family protein [Thermoanaerobaculaceae bacterium]
MRTPRLPRRLSPPILLLAAVAVGGCASVAAKGEPPLEVIDAHVHTNFDNKFYDVGKVMHSKVELATEMKRNHVVGAVSMNHAGDPYEDLSDLNVVHCAGIAGTYDAARLENGLATRRYRCIKIYLGYVHQYASDPAYEPAYKLAETYHVPVVFHTGDTDSPRAKLKYADPLTVDEVAVDHPKVTFVLAHAGNPWIESAAEVAYKNPNVVLDGSAFLIGDLKTVPPEQLETYLVRPVRWIFNYVGDPTKLMFGTDWPLTDIGPYLEAFKRAIPRENWKAVFHDNAVRVYGFDAARGTE